MKTRIDFITEAVAGISIVLQPDEILRIVSFILTCLSVLISVAFTVYKWYKEAKRDGKIDADEVDDLVNKIKDNIDKGSKNG